MDLTEYLDFEVFRKTFNKRGDTSTMLLLTAGESIEHLTTSALVNLNYKLYGLWPNNRTKEILILGAKRGIQTLFYEKMFNKKPNDNMLKLNEDVKLRLDLKKEKYVDQQVVEVVSEGKIIKKHYKNEFSKKIGEMSLENVAQWARDLGIPKDKIEKHLAKPVGLAKMNLGNLIRAKIS